MKLIPADAMRRMPWKNGGGVTTEIAIAPEGATLDNFDWRISTAQVDAAGPFSRFTGFDRSLAVIAGGRLTMHRADGNVISLAPGEAPVRFPGEVDIHATVDAPLSDFNVMTRRDTWVHHAEPITLAAGERRSLPTTRARMQWVVYCVHGALSLDGADVSLSQGAAVWLDAPSGNDTLVARVGSVGYLVALWPVA
ncbi:MULTISPECIES: HutD family protein [Ralstonia]|jgi:environmental stress-induced protein Ves|uniref:Protein Ves n=1 Tax=Ralstonia flaminis TaxID=3058597 RepID=A0ABM9K3A6_9RALS|nr:MULTISPECIES: HutD family protein [unclassified Ralstonia]CAJ0811003.1 Protein Ves [Ralstonia sp. LMG 18101]